MKKMSKNSRNILVLLLAASLAVLFSGAAFAGNYAEGEALVVLKPASGAKITRASVRSGADASRAVTVARSAGARVARTYADLSEVGNKLYMLVKSDTKTTEQLVAELSKNPDVMGVSPNYKITMRDKTPNDPEFSSSTGDGLWGIRKINAPKVWDTTTGSENIYVAVLDTGIDKEHVDLKDNIAPRLK